MKKCVICEESEAEYCVKDMPNQCYCKECAEENFGDINTLTRLDEPIEKAISEILPDEIEDEDGGG